MDQSRDCCSTLTIVSSTRFKHVGSFYTCWTTWKLFEALIFPAFRTVYSVLERTPPEYLKEIVLVDDASNLTEIVKTLPRYLESKSQELAKVILHKEPKQLGLIGARSAGAKVASGDVIIFLDSHCEATTGWIQPLLQRIKDRPSNIAIPSIDSISSNSLEFQGETNH